MADIIDFQKSRFHYLHAKAESAASDGDVFGALENLRDYLYYSRNLLEIRAALMLMGQMFGEYGDYETARFYYFKSLLPKFGAVNPMSLLGISTCAFRKGNDNEGFFYAGMALDEAGGEMDRDFYRAYIAGSAGIDPDKLEDEWLESRNCLRTIDFAEEERREAEFELLNVIAMPDSKSEKAFRKFVKYHPEFKDDPWTMAVELTVDVGKCDFKEAEKIAQKRRAVLKSDIEYVKDMLLIYDVSGDAEGFCAFIEKLRNIRRPASDAEFLDLIALLIQYNLNEEAVEKLSYLKDKRNREQYPFYKAWALAYYNTGDTRTALKIFKRLDRIFGEAKDARYYVDYMGRFDAKDFGTLPLCRNFMLPDVMRTAFSAIIAEALSRDFYKAFLREPVLRLSLDYLFDCEDFEGIAEVLGEMIKRPNADYADYLQEKLLLTGERGMALTHKMVTALVLGKPNATVRFLMDDGMFEFKLSRLRESGVYPAQFKRAFLSFAALMCIEEDDAEDKAVRIFKRLCRAIKPEDAGGFGSEGALAALMMVAARAEDGDAEEYKRYFSMFSTTCAAVKKYAKAAGFDEVSAVLR